MPEENLILKYEGYPNYLYNQVTAYEIVEGKGNRLNNQPLRGYGLADSEYNRILAEIKMHAPNNKANLSDYEAALYLSFENYDYLVENIVGFSDAPKSVKWAISDLAYNIQGGATAVKTNYPKMQDALIYGEYLEVARQMMDSVYAPDPAAGGKSKVVPGLFARAMWRVNKILERTPYKLHNEELTPAEQREGFIIMEGLNSQHINNMLASNEIVNNPARYAEYKNGWVRYLDIDKNIIFQFKSKQGLHSNSKADALIKPKVTGYGDVDWREAEMGWIKKVMYGN